VVASLLLLALAAPAAAPPAGALSPAYEAVVRQYASGDREAAVAGICGWPDKRLRDEMTALADFREKARARHSCPEAMAWPSIPVRPALMLHSDCAERARREGERSRLHESVAVTIAGLIEDDPARRDFARRWYESMAGLAQGENRWVDALHWAERGLRAFPDSSEMRLVVGSIEETLGAQLGFREAGEALVAPDPRWDRSEAAYRRTVRAHLEKAHRVLRAAVAADPSLLEARLRLGRVAWRLGETAEARSVLTDVLGQRPEAGTALLAHLFLGRLDEDAGRLDEAARSYEAALALDASAQSARIALSHVRLRRGDPASARAEVERAIGVAGHRLRPDPFWLYPWGPSVGVEDRLQALRREASS
jgi:hypothetical protein